MLALPRPRAMILAAAAAGIAATALAAPGSALATTTTSNEAISGATVSSLSMSIPTTAVLTGITPGGTASGTAALAVLATGSWTLGIADSNTGSGAGRPASSGAANCTGSEARLLSPLSVALTTLTGASPTLTNVSLTGTNQTVASGTSSATFTAGYSDPIASTEVLTTGCTYSLTATYTLTG